MRRFAAVPTLAAAALIALAAPLSAAPTRYDFDLSHSEVGFSIRHFFSRVSGVFTDFTGTLMLDEQNLSNSSVEATIRTASIDTNNERRDKHLRTADFFASDSIPTMTFKSTKVTAGEKGRLKIEGDLMIRGVTRPVVLDVHFLGAGPLDMGGYSAGYRAGFEATTTVDRKDFNILWNRQLDQGGVMLGDDVEIAINIEAVRIEPESKSGKK